ISRAGNHLLSLINEVLDIARIEAGRLALAHEPIDVTELLITVVELIRPLAARRSIEVIVEPSCHNSHHVFADLQRLRQVLLNLLSNAVKYNREAGEIRISCTEISGRLRMSVRDTGHGIAAEKFSRLFVPFERL